jgi:glycine oxidase
LLVGADNSDMAVIDRLVAYHGVLGLESGRLTSRQCRELVPSLAPGVRGGVSAPCDHQVDNRLLAEALQVACNRSGAGASVEIVRLAVEGLLLAASSSSSERVVGVRLSDGTTVSAPVVVAATGCWPLPGVPDGVLPPVRPVKGHILRLHGRDGSLIDRNVRCIVHGSSVYLVPRDDGTIVVGATVEERGYDTNVQAGGVYELLRDAREMVPGIAELELLESVAGLRPGSPDNGPFIGWTELEGLAVATGHYRNGILLAPITADAICDLVAGRKVNEFVEPFGVDRF